VVPTAAAPVVTVLVGWCVGRAACWLWSCPAQSDRGHLNPKVHGAAKVVLLCTTTGGTNDVVLHKGPSSTKK
jgi:hypothetical protein